MGGPGGKGPRVRGPRTAQRATCATLGAMFLGLAIILGCQLVGEVLVRATGAPIPGPVVGMVLFFVWLSIRKPKKDAGEVQMADTLVRYLPIMFVPTTVGVVVYGGVVAEHWLPAIVGGFGTWLVTLVLVGWIAQGLRPRRPRRGEH